MRQKIHRLAANGLTHFVRDSGDEASPVAILLHGFPDSSALWEEITPTLVAAGFRVIAPDLRGFGDTDIAARKRDYDMHDGAVPDVVAIMDNLNILTAHLAGHDFGATVAWRLAALHPERFFTLSAISVGHVRAYLNAGPEQWRMSWYILFHQMRWLCETAYRFNNWALLRKQWDGLGDVNDIIRQLSRPRRLTAGLNWYRANISLTRMMRPPPIGAFGDETVRIPTLGLWSDDDKYLAEKQMKLSRKFVEAPWRYKKIAGAGHWIPHDKPDELAHLLIEHWRSV
ncbi:MAG: alpha/beta hydrolase [Marinicaulis sp.]|nr:alpha/beta hydrolase [Marinicaulis sp.]NNL87909.1 alpha/beta hydrolase [Marinicaulis sp.]